jgi:hypothetical protein
MEMAQFFGSAQGRAGQGTRLGTKSSGLTTEAAGWGGCIETRLWYDSVQECDKFEVILRPWQGSEGSSKVLASGRVDATADVDQFSRTNEFPFWQKRKYGKLNSKEQGEKS